MECHDTPRVYRPGASCCPRSSDSWATVKDTVEAMPTVTERKRLHAGRAAVSYVRFSPGGIKLAASAAKAISDAWSWQSFWPRPRASIRRHRDLPSSAYIDKARNDLGKFQLRDALANARRALEMLSNKVWKWLGSHELGELRLTMHGPTSPLTLRRDTVSRLTVSGRPTTNESRSYSALSQINWARFSQ